MYNSDKSDEDEEVVEEDDNEDVDYGESVPRCRKSSALCKMKI